MSISDLPIHNMAERHTGLTPAIAAVFWEALCVCLDRHHKSPIVFLLIDDELEAQTRLSWIEADEKCLRAYANEIDTTEAGAYGCTLAAVELKRGLVAVHRAETGTGADYYIGPVNEEFEDLENCLRLEVSGTNKGSSAVVKQRLREKVQQAKDGNSNLPALAAVIGFQSKLIAIETVQEIS